MSARAPRTRYFFFDFETFPIQPGALAPPPVCCAYAFDRDAPKLVPAWTPFLPSLLEKCLRDPNVVMVAHNAAFEVGVMMAWRPEWTPLIFQALREGRIRCTYIRDKLIRIGRGDDARLKNLTYALDDVCEYWRLPIMLDKKSPWRTRYGTLYGKPITEWPAEAVEYALGDVATRDVYFRQEQVDPQYLIDQHNKLKTSVSLHLTSCWGFAVDIHQARELAADTAARIDQAQASILKHGLARWVKRKGEMFVQKDKKAAEALVVEVCRRTGRDVPRGAPTEKMLEKGLTEGNIKLDADTLRELKDPLLEDYREFTQASTTMSKVLRLVRAAEAGKPIQCSYNPVVNTGRTSSRQGDDPAPGEPWSSYGMQMQNQLRDIKLIDPTTGKETHKPGTRECFIARDVARFIHEQRARGLTFSDALNTIVRPKWCIVSVDYDSFELRTWAQVCFWVLGYSDLREILNDPARCPHIEMGARLWKNEHGEHVSVEEAYRWKKGTKDEKTWLKKLRGLAKGPNFGLPGGMGAARLVDYCFKSYGVTISIEEAELACRVWREIYAESQPYLDWVSQDLLGGRYGARATIEQFVSKRLRGDVGFCDAANGMFQGLAADIATAAGWRLVEAAYENRRSPLYGCRPLAFIHDEWLYEVPRELIHEAGNEMARIMISTAKEYCPDLYFSALPAASYRWSKAAGDPVYRNGELIPYEEAA